MTFGPRFVEEHEKKGPGPIGEARWSYLWPSPLGFSNPLLWRFPKMVRVQRLPNMWSLKCMQLAKVRRISVTPAIWICMMQRVWWIIWLPRLSKRQDKHLIVPAELMALTPSWNIKSVYITTWLPVMWMYKQSSPSLFVLRMELQFQKMWKCINEVGIW